MKPAARLVRLVSSLLVAVGTAVLVVTVAVAVFSNPFWLTLSQERARATALTGYTIVELGVIDNALLGDIFLGPGRFDVALRGEPVFNDRERQHLAEVRSVFLGLGAAAIVSAVVLVVVHRLRSDRSGYWMAVRAGAGALAGAVLGAAIFVVVAFPIAFELFHRLLFTGGTYTFDPATERLVQVFPQQLWFDTTLAAGIVIVIVSTWLYQSAGRRAKSAADTGPAPAAAFARPEPSG